MSRPDALKGFLPHLIILATAFLLYANTLFYDYTLDDLIVIKGNAFTLKGTSGIADIFKYDSFTGFYGVQKKLVAGGRYRPLSIATFALEHQLFHGLNPVFSRLINILVYGFTGILILLIFSRLIPARKDKPWFRSVPFLAAMLFIAHPVHTEVVANIKGRDELLSLFFSLFALWSAIRYLEKRSVTYLILSCTAFFLGLLSKENAIMFLLIIPLTLYFFTRHPVKKYAGLTAMLFMVSLGFIFIRFLVLGYLNSPELPGILLNNPFLFASEDQKAGTILLTLGLYVKLLFVPYPLTHDYYPYHIPLTDITEIGPLVSLLVYIALLACVAWLFRRKHIVSYGILFYLATLFIVSNILFSVGTFMNERFIYMPSVGFVLILAWFLAEKLPGFLKNRQNAVIVSIALLILVPFGALTINRNTVWKDDLTLFTSDVKVSQNSLKCNTSAGGKLIEKAQSESPGSERDRDFELALKYLRKADSIYPNNNNTLVLLANGLVYSKNDYRGASELYLRVLSFDPYDKTAYGNLAKVAEMLTGETDTPYRKHLLTTLYAINPDDPGVNHSLGKLYGQYLGKYDSAAWYLERSATLGPGVIDTYRDLGIVYGLMKDYPRSLEAFNKALQIDPQDEIVKQNIAVTNRLISQAKKP